jgi:hypothetical protein
MLPTLIVSRGPKGELSGWVIKWMSWVCLHTKTWHCLEVFSLEAKVIDRLSRWGGMVVECGARFIASDRIGELEIGVI